MKTILFRSGTVVDGTGRAAFPGHVLVEGDRIRSVMQEGQDPPRADTEIDISGKVIAPGFIDMHSHMDWILPRDDHPGLLKCFLEQGITTVIGGNCGYSPAPIQTETLTKADASMVSIITELPLDYSWRTMADFFDRIDERKPVMNIAQQVGHASIRVVYADTLRGAMSPAEQDKCLDAARRSLDEGACGLSLGLGYEPGMFSPLEEIEAFARVAAQANKPLSVHLKAMSWLSPTYPLTTLGSHNLKAIREMIGIARKTGVTLQISHFIFVGRNTWRTIPEGLKLVEQAHRDGVDVMIDGFPYTFGNTYINAVLPYWFLKSLPGGFSSRFSRMRCRTEFELGFRLVGFGYKDFQVMDAVLPELDDINGMTVDQVARHWKMNPFDALLRLSEITQSRAWMLFHTYSGAPGKMEGIHSVLTHDLCLFETDAMVRTRGFGNPAAIGTFPKLLGEYVRDKKLLRMEDAIRRMTSLSARRFGLKDRGEIAEGQAADLVVFDPGTIAEVPAVGSKPAGRPRGIEYVYINGQRVVENGGWLDGVRAGRSLRN
jgi:N-acyl-D-amino-acid deacylase